MKITVTKTERATIVSASDGEGPPVVASIPVEVCGDDSPFAAKTAALLASVATFADANNAADARLLPEARGPEVRSAAARVFGLAGREAIAAGQSEKQAIAAADALLLEPLPGDGALYSDYRNAFKLMTTAEKANFATTANLHQTSALLQAGREHFPDTPEPVWAEIENRHILHGHVRRSGLQADHQRQPTADNPLATGPDTEAALRASHEALKAHQTRRDRVVLLEGALRSIVNVVAAVTELHPSDAFKLVSGEKL